MKKFKLTCIAIMTVLPLTLGSQAWAQKFPPKNNIKLVVGFAGGGAADGAARLIAKTLGENIGARVIVENKGGAGGNIAHHQVANGPTDGSVLLLGSIGPLTIAPHIMKLNYDPFKDLAAVSGGVTFPNVLVVHKGLGVNTLAEFVELSKKTPGSIDFASTGIGSASHLAGELLSQQAGIEMVHVPYKGGALALQDTLGERVASYFSAPPTALQHVESGRLVPLATTGITRPVYLPDIPTVAESGYPAFEAMNWFAFVAPGKTPEPILERWNLEIVKVLNDPEVKDALNKFGLTPQPTTRAELTALMRAEDKKWSAVVKERKIIAE